MLDGWLARDNRRLSPSQRESVDRACLGAGEDCSPLLLRMLYEESRLWSSYDVDVVGQPVDLRGLPATAEAAIDRLFDRLEGEHGTTFVGHALAFLSLAKTGLTVPEMEDVLSSVDGVLAAAFEWWTPPLARLPPLLLTRLLWDLRQYVFETSSGSLAWQHQLFARRALRRYAGDPLRLRALHGTLGDYWTG